MPSLSPLDREKTYLVYCRTGRHSRESLVILTDMGFKSIYNMEGGISSFKVAHGDLVE